MPLLRQTVAVALVAIFVLLSALHVYWAFGGRWGANVAVPEIAGRPAFRPGRAATLTVAALLGAAAAIIGSRSTVPSWQGVAPLLVPLVRLGVWTLAATFAVRAVGDFTTFGFFKAARGTDFARYDTLLFSPLCVAIALGCLLVALGP